MRGSIKSLGKEYTKKRMAGSIAELKQKIAASATGKEAKRTVRKLENRIKDLAEIIQYAEQYKTNKPYNIAYKKSKNPDEYFRKHERQITLYGSAGRMLEQPDRDNKLCPVKSYPKEALKAKKALQTRP